MPRASGPTSPSPIYPPNPIIPTAPLRLHRRPSFVLDITAHLDDKMRALACYHSQFIQGRPTTPPTLLDDVRDRARSWGWAVGTAYGEPFVCREEVGLRGLRDL